jgi:hypothetical protein
LTLAAAVVLTCAGFRAAPAAARFITVAEEAALAEIRSYLANYYGNAGDPRINEIVSYARERMLAIDDENDWNADDGNPDQPVISPKPPNDGAGGDEDYAGGAVEQMLESFRKEELARQKNHYRKTLTPTPKGHWSYEEDDEGAEKNPDEPGRITPYEQELIDKIVAEKVEEQRKNLEEEFADAGRYIDDARNDPAGKKDYSLEMGDWAEGIKDVLDTINDIPLIGDLLGEAPVVGDLMQFVPDLIDNPTEAAAGKIIDMIAEKIPMVGDSVGVLLKVTVSRLVTYYTMEESYPEGFFTVEFIPLLGAGIGLMAASVAVYAITQAADSAPAVFDAVSLGVALATDSIILATRTAMKATLEEWEEEINENYETDHAAFSGFAYTSSLPGVMSAQSRLSVPGGASFVMDAGKRASAFNSLHPGYGTSPGGIYIEDYKKIADNWRAYAASHREVSLSEAAGLVSAQAGVNAIKKHSRDASGYSQGMHAHNEARLTALQQTLKLRMDVARQTDFRARAALDRQQKREDLHAAFGRASGGWTLSAGVSY